MNSFRLSQSNMDPRVHRATPTEGASPQPPPSNTHQTTYPADIDGTDPSRSNSDQLTSPADLESTMQPIPKPKPNEKDFGIKAFSSPDDPIVDIVAIHGLDGHREETWMAQNGTLWLRDFLPSDLPKARILSYGYDANTGCQESISTEIMRRDAQKFASTLVRKRRDAPRRPIIFIAHDLGGIILKWALVICDNQRPRPGPIQRDDLQSVLVSTQAILFFGTPHFGVKDEIIDAIQHMASVYTHKTDKILDQLREDSSELENVQELYAGISKNIHRVCFYSGCSQGKKGDMSVSYRSAVIAGDPDARKESLHASHKEMVKLSKDDEGYDTVCDYIKEFARSAVQEVGAKWVTEDRIRSAANGR